MLKREVLVAETIDTLNRRAVEIIVERTQRAIAERGRCTLALGGGSTPKPIYEALAGVDGLDWSCVFVFWGDERFVPLDNAWSNYRLAREALIARVPSLPAANVFPSPVDVATPAIGAALYSQAIREFSALEPGKWPRFDLTINGMGPDGHTASLFPNAPAEPPALVHARHAGLTPWVDRLTLSLEVFNHARCVLFLAAGANKAERLRQVLEEVPDSVARPASAVRPEEGELIWLIDEPAAERLTLAVEKVV